MRNVLFILILLSAFACKKYEPVENVEYAPLKSYSIQQEIDLAEVGDTVLVPAGIYTEQIILRNGVDLYLPSWAELRWTTVLGSNYDEFLISDGGNPVVCTIYGDGKFKLFEGTYGWTKSIIQVDNYDSDITLCYDSVRNNVRYGSGGIVKKGILRLNGDVFSASDYGIEIHQRSGYPKEDQPTLYWTGGELYTDGQVADYAITNSGVCYLDGTIYSSGNSAVGCYGGLNSWVHFTGHAYSTAYFGFEVGGGNAVIYDAVIESKVTDNPVESVALSVYSGNTVSIENTTLLSAHADAHCLDNQYNSAHALITVGEGVYANREITVDESPAGYPCPPMNIVSGFIHAIPVENLTGIFLKKGRYKTVELNWESDLGEFGIYKDGDFLGLTTDTYWIDTVRANFKRARYDVETNIETLEPGVATIIVEK